MTELTRLDEARAQVAYLRGRIERVLERHDRLRTLCRADEYELRSALHRLDTWSQWHGMPS